MSSNVQTKWGQFGTLITVFFFWGFVAASNSILIPVFKEKFDLSAGQSQFVELAFYIAYSVGSLLYMGVSNLLKTDLLGKMGYKTGISVGLAISAVGTLMFYPAAEFANLNLMLAGLFIVGLGFALQQIAANPLAISMGDPATGSQRLSMAGGINNLGTTIGPVLISYAIFGSASATTTETDLNTLKAPYLLLGAAFLLVAAILYFSSVPNKIATEETLSSDLSESATDNSRKSAFSYPQLWLGMIGIFVYVGVEVATQSNLPQYLSEGLGIPKESVSPYISLYWASLMIGRWSAAVGAFGVSAATEKLLKLIVPFLAFGVFLGVNSGSENLSDFYPYAGVILLLIAGDYLSKGNPARMLLIFAAMGISALVIGMLTTGIVSVFAFMSVGLFCSTLWPCIFTLAVSGLGKHTGQGSSLLILMICGGGFISTLQGAVAESIGIHYSYIVGVVCFAYLAFYAVTVMGILKRQGIDYDAKITGGGH
jgi:FHS family L-fucose permease-like MFS transporter